MNVQKFSVAHIVLDWAMGLEWVENINFFIITFVSFLHFFYCSASLINLIFFIHLVKNDSPGSK